MNSNYQEFVKQIIIIENGSTNGNEIEKKFDSLPIKYLYVEKANKSYALNEGLKCVEKDSYIIFFDDDITVDTHIFEAYSEAINIYGKNYFYGGPMLPDYEKYPDKNIIKYLPASAKGYKQDLKEPGKSTKKYVMGCNWCCNKEILLKAGIFDVTYGPGTQSRGQETNMMDRLIKQNITSIYVPAAKVYHYIPENRSNLKWLLNRKKEQEYNVCRNLTLLSLFKHLIHYSKMFLKSFIKGDTIGTRIFFTRVIALINGSFHYKIFRQ